MSGQVGEGSGSSCQFVLSVDLLSGQPGHFSFQEIKRHGAGVVGGEQLGALVGERRDATASAGLVLFGLSLFGAEFDLYCLADGSNAGGTELEATVEAGDGRFDGVKADDGAAAGPPFGCATEA